MFAHCRRERASGRAGEHCADPQARRPPTTVDPERRSTRTRTETRRGDSEPRRAADQSQMGLPVDQGSGAVVAHPAGGGAARFKSCLPDRNAPGDGARQGANNRLLKGPDAGYKASGPVVRGGSGEIAQLRSLTTDLPRRGPPTYHAGGPPTYHGTDHWASPPTARTCLAWGARAPSRCLRRTGPAVMRVGGAPQRMHSAPKRPLSGWIGAWASQRC